MRTVRRGFTLIELLVVVTIIVVLLSMLVPGMGKAVDAAMETQCKSNLRQNGAGMIGYGVETGVLPASYMGGQTLNSSDGIAVAWPAQVRAYANDSTDIFYCPMAEPETRWVRTMGSSNPAKYGYDAGEYWVSGYLPGGTSYGHNNDGTRTHWSAVGNGKCGMSDNPDDPNQYVRVTLLRQPSQFICIGDSKIDGVWDAFIDYQVGGEDLAIRHHGGANIIFYDGHVAWVNSPEYEDNSGCGCIDPLKARMWNNDFLFP
jgi:prepilin-type N-terminal cleavage/methylation domain-containing protein/prepilin-type processing-associated H-X9-DG protein